MLRGDVDSPLMLVLISGGEHFDGFEGLSAVLLVAGIIAVVVFALTFAVRWFASMPKLPPEGPATNELGDEPPAVVNLLVHRWKLTHTAIAATLVDLAARGTLEIDYIGRDTHVVRLRENRPGVPGAETPYEKQVLDLVRRRATGGSAPVEALDLGSASEAEGFWKRFEKSVVKEARSRGLARSRWAASDFTVLGALMAIALGLIALAFSVARLGEGSGSGDDEWGRWDWLGAAAVAWIGGMVALGALRDLRDTPAGREICARWLGVRRYFRDSGAFDDLPPGSVSVWERYLAYATAVGAAHETARALPLSADDPETAWSRYGGDWREVRVDYPVRFGFGQSPGKVLLGGLWRTALFGGIAFVALPIVADIAFELPDVIFDNASTGNETGLRALVGGIILFITGAGIYLIIRLIAGLIWLWRGLADLGRWVEMEGEVAKLHLGRAAIVDGKSAETNAWFPPPGTGVARGMIVRIRRSPRLWHVGSLEVVSRPAAVADDHAHEAGLSTVEPAITTPGIISLPQVSEIVGHQLRLATGATAATVAPFQALGARVQAFDDAEGHSVAVAVVPARGLAGRAMATMLKRGAPGGPGPSWTGERLIVESGDALTIIHVHLPERSPEVRRQMAERILELVTPTATP